MDQSNQAQLHALVAEYLQRPMRIEEAAKYLGISKSYLYKLTSKSEISHFKPSGKTIYFQKSDLDNWAMSRRVVSREEMRRHVESR